MFTNWPESSAGSSTDSSSRASAAAAAPLPHQDTLHTFQTPPRLFQTSEACWGSILGPPLHHHNHCSCRSAWACCGACWEAGMWAGRAWWWTAGWICSCWSGSIALLSSQDPNSCQYHFLPGNKNMLWPRSKEVFFLLFFTCLIW